MKTTLRDLRPDAVLLALAVLAGCGGSGGGDSGDEGNPPPPPAARAPDTARVSAQGAVLETTDGARVDIPPGASMYTYTASIAKSTEGAPPLSAGLAPMGGMYSLQPHGAVFTAPIRVSLPFDPAAVPPGATVKVARGEPGGRWEILPGEVQGDRISVRTDGFSFYMPVIMQTITYTFPATTPFGEVTMAGQAPVDAQTPQALLANGDPNPFVPIVNYRVFTQAQLATPMTLTLRGAMPAGSDIDLWCANKPLRLVVAAFTARIYPDPANASRTLVRTNRMVRWQSGFTFDDPVELASLPMPRDGQTRTLDFSVNLAAYAYKMGEGDYPPDPWTGGPADFSGWGGGPDPFPLTGAAGLTLATAFICDTVNWFGDYDRSPKTALRRGFPDTLGFTEQPANQTVVEGEPATFRTRLPTLGTPTSGTVYEVTKWQRSFTGAPDTWFDLDPALADPVDGTVDGWRFDDGSDNPLFSDPLASRIRRESVNRAQHHGTRYRAVACQYDGQFPSSTLTQCLPSAGALLTVTQDFVAPQVLTSPTPQITVRENDTSQVTQFSATFSGVPRPAVSWETKAPGSPAWEPVDPATHTLSGSTLSTRRAFTLADRGREYRAVARNFGGSTTSFSSVLFVTTGLEAPAITTQPQDAQVAAGNAVLFAASVTGSAPMSYQWYFNGSAIPGANGPLLTLNNVNPGNAGSYQLEARNRENVVRSRLARLGVSLTPVAPPEQQAPTIVMQPAAVNVTVGNTATLAVAARGGEPLAYQWLRNGEAVKNATASALTIAAVGEADAGRYAVVVSNTAGRATSDSVNLAVTPAEPGPPQPVAPSITTQPVGLAVLAGQGATLAVAVTGSAPLSYQWRRNGVPLAGATGPILSLAAASANDAGQYSVVVSNAAGQATSADAGLVVTPPPGAPVITAQPGSLSVLVGQPATFVFDVAGSPAPSCVWLRNGVRASAGEACGSFTVPAATLADNGAVYSVVVVNAGGYVISAPAVLTVTDLVPPQITQQPADVDVVEGGNASFSVTASANGPLTYAWERIGGATTASDNGSLSLPGVTLADHGAQFRARVCNGPQSDNRCTLSRIATLTVTTAVPVGALTATQVVAGHEWSVVLRPDRTVWGWGGLHKVDGTVVVANLNPADQARRPVQLYPATLSDVRQIAGWYDGFWALKGEPGSAASRVLHWGSAHSANDGRGSDGAGNLGPIPQSRVNAAPVEMLERRSVGGTLQAAPVDRVCSLAATSDRVLLIRALDAFGTPTDCNPGSTKTVWVAGTLTQFGSDAVGVAVPVQGLPAGVPARVIAQQATAQSFSGPVLVLMEDGRAYGWGTNIGNLFGLPLPASQSYVGNNVAPQALPGAWGTATDAAFSYVGLIVRRSDGSAMVSGRNDNGELGLGPQTSGTVNNGPLPLLASAGVALDGVQALASSQVQVSLALRQGRILVWGAANQPMQGGSTARIDYPQLLPASGDGWRALSAANAHALAIAANGAVYTWGNGLRGALGNGVDGGSALAPTLVTVP